MRERVVLAALVVIPSVVVSSAGCHSPDGAGGIDAGSGRGPGPDAGPGSPPDASGPMPDAAPPPSGAPEGCSIVAYGGDPNNNSSVHAVTLGSDGTVYLAGHTATDDLGYSTSSNYGWLAAVGPTEANAAYPTAFGWINAAAASPAGKIFLVAGQSYENAWKFARASAGGTLDMSFTFSVVGTGSAVSYEGQPMYQSTGRLVFTAATNSAELIARATADGVLDPTFGSAGVIAMATTDVPIAPLSMTLDASDRIYVAGYATSSADGFTHWEVVRFTPDGALDATFGTGGIVDAGLAPDAVYIPGLQLRTSRSGSDFYLLARDGEAVWGTLRILHGTAMGVDAAYGEAGSIEFSGPAVEPNLSLDDAAVQDDGALLVTGEGAGVNTWYLTRITASGQLDTSYGSGGWITGSPPIDSERTITPVAVRVDTAGQAILVLDDLLDADEGTSSAHEAENADVCQYSP